MIEIVVLSSRKATSLFLRIFIARITLQWKSVFENTVSLSFYKGLHNVAVGGAIFF